MEAPVCSPCCSALGAIPKGWRKKTWAKNKRSFGLAGASRWVLQLFSLLPNLSFFRFSQNNFSFSRFSKGGVAGRRRKKKRIWWFLTHNPYHFGVFLPLDALGETPINTNGSYRSTGGEERPPPCARCIAPEMCITGISLNLTAVKRQQSQRSGNPGNKRHFLLCFL